MLARIVTRPLPDDTGDERAALKRAHALFPIIWETLRRRGRQTIQFSKAAMPVLNQAVRPFTAKRHARTRWSILQQGWPCRISLGVGCPCGRLAQSRRVVGSCLPLPCPGARPGQGGAVRNRPEGKRLPLSGRCALTSGRRATCGVKGAGSKRATLPRRPDLLGNLTV